MVKKSGASVNAISFQEAATTLFTPVSHAELADELDCSVSLVRQALRGVRNPPGGWEVTVRRMLEARADHFTKLAQRLRPKE